MEPRVIELRAGPAPAKCAHCVAPFTPTLADQSLCAACQAEVPPEPRAHLRESDVAGCKLVHQLGSGRFATSWLAEAADGSPVVVKLLHAYAPDSGTVQRFLAEVQRLAHLPELEHPSIAQLLSGGVQLGTALFLVYRSGGDATLADELRSRGRIVASRALELGAQLAEALGVLHANGVLHLDLKPANVALLREPDRAERAVLLDAATAHLLAHAQVADDGPPILSTAAYVSPEEAGGGQAGPRSDLYSVGALLFQCISGRLPVLGSTPEELIAAHLEQRVLTLRDVGRKAHPQLEEVLARALAKDPDERYASGEEMAAALREVIPVADRATAGAEAPSPVPDPIRVLNGFSADIADPLRGEQPEDGFVELERSAGRPRKLLAVAAAVVAFGALAVIALRQDEKQPPLPSPVPASRANVAPAPPPVVIQPAAADALDEPSTPARAMLRRAQLQVTAGDARGAEVTLRQVLAQPELPRRDLSHAMRLMGSAEARRGRRDSAVDWYRKSLRLTDDASERARVVRIIQRLTHP
jgi:serine/threonine-protein kinase